MYKIEKREMLGKLSSYEHMSSDSLYLLLNVKDVLRIYKNKYHIVFIL